MSAEPLRLGPGWLHLHQSGVIVTVCSLQALDGRSALAALPPGELPAAGFVANVVLRKGERRHGPDALHLVPKQEQLHVNLTEPVALEQWHGARLELRTITP